MNARKNEERVKKYDTRDKLLESDWLKNTKRNLQATKAADEMMLRDAYKNTEPQPTKRALIDLIKLFSVSLGLLLRVIIKALRNPSRQGRRT
jgi:hypothetical protein